MLRNPSIRMVGTLPLQRPMAQPRMLPVRPNRLLLGSYKKGGTVKRTGAYKLHKGERVIPLSKILRGK